MDGLLASSETFTETIAVARAVGGELGKVDLLQDLHAEGNTLPANGVAYYRARISVETPPSVGIESDSDVFGTLPVPALSHPGIALLIACLIRAAFVGLRESKRTRSSS